MDDALSQSNSAFEASLMYQPITERLQKIGQRSDLRRSIPRETHVKNSVQFYFEPKRKYKMTTSVFGINILATASIINMTVPV